MPAERRAKIINLALFAVIAFAALWGIWQGQRIMRADLHGMQARYRVNAWATGRLPWTITEWLQAREDLRASARIAPDSPLTFDFLGMLYSLRGQRGWNVPELRVGYYTEAMQAQKASLALRPENGAAWANLALSQFAVEDPAGAAESMRNAIRYGPYEVVVKHRVTEIVFAMGRSAPADLRTWLRQRYETGLPDEKRDIEKLAKQYKFDLKTL